MYSAAVRHFLSWLSLRDIVIGTLDDFVVQRFEKHRCRCTGYSAQHAGYKADIAARVRRFVRFLEDQGFVDVVDGIYDLGGHLADYSDAIEGLQLANGASQTYRSEAEHFAAWLRISRRSWTDVDDRVIEQYAGHHCRCPVFRRRGKLAVSGKKRRRRCSRHFVRFLRDRHVIAVTEVEAVGDPLTAAYLGWLKQHRGASAETIRKRKPSPAGF